MDIVKRLRAMDEEQFYQAPATSYRDCQEAADEIERLNRRVRTLEAALSGIVLWEEDYAYASDIPQKLIKTARVALKTVEG